MSTNKENDISSAIAKKHDEELMERYREIEHECSHFDQVKDKMPVSVVDEIMDFLETRHFTFYDLRAKIIPYCIEYRITHKSFWMYIQKRRKILQ